MSLRIVRPVSASGNPGPTTRGSRSATSENVAGREGMSADQWPSRVAKLIPAEALALYGSAQTVIPNGNLVFLWILAAACLVLAVSLRFQATKDANGEPQWVAIIIAGVSFCLWILSLKPQTGPVDLGAYAFVPGFCAIIWSAFVPLFYKGD